MAELPEAALGMSAVFQRVMEHSTSNTLYELSDEYLAVLAVLDEVEVDPAQEEMLLARLDAIGRDIRQKSEAIAGLIAHLEYRADARKAEGKRLTQRGKSDQNKADWLRQYLKANMDAMGTERIETVRFTLAVRLNNPHVEIVDPDAVPEDFKRKKIIVEPDLEAIQTHFRETGEIVPGTTMVRTPRLQIQ